VKSKTLLIAISLSWSVNAYAATKLYTPTLWAVSPDGFACNLTNVGHKTRWVKIRIITNGEILLDGDAFRLAPQITSDEFVEGLPDGGPIYCEFAVQGSKDDFRGAAKLFELPNSSDFAVVAAQ
jgi:hypothetical protein